jgi:hypothetical protein
MERLVGIAGIAKYLAETGRRVSREGRGLSIPFGAGGVPRRMDFLWDKAPGTITVFVTLGEAKIPAERRVEIGGRLSELNTKLAAPGFTLGQSCVIYQTLLVRNHDDSVSPHVLETLLAAAAAELEQHGEKVKEILGG